MQIRPPVDIVGNVTADPELKFTPTGNATCDFSIAVNPRKKDPHGQWVEDDPEFFKIICWGQLAENVVESIGKGDRVMVMGELRQRSWTGNDDKRHSVIEIYAQEIGPTLRWATAQPVKNPRDGQSRGFASPPPTDEGPDRTTSSAETTTTAPASPFPAQASYGDEEPF